MLSMMLFATSLVLIINAVLWCVFVSWYGLLSLPFIAFTLWLTRQLTTKTEAKMNTEGWDIGEGIDIENPDRPQKVSAFLEDEALNLGLLAIGGPKSGKTIMAIGMLEYLTKQREGGWVYWEGKGDLDIYQQTCACGAHPDKFFSSELPYSDTTNVFAGPVDNVIDRLTTTFISYDSEYYGNAQRSALRKVIPLLKALDMPVTLQDLYVVLAVSDASHYVLNLAKKQKVAPDIIEAARLFFSIDENERLNQINGLLNRMDIFVSGNIATRINAYEPTLDLEKASKEGQKVYMHLPYTQLAKDIATLLTEEIGVIARNRQLYETQRVPWPQVFDDWGAFFYENFGPITARCRSARMPISFLFQSRAQTDRVDGNRIFTTEITDNIGGMVILRINGEDTAEWAARQFGSYQTTELSHSHNTEYEGNNLSDRKAPRVESDALKSLDAGEAYLKTLVTGEGGAVATHRYKVRFPLPDFTGADQISWPTIETTNNDQCNGLHLWRDFMNKDRLKSLKNKIIKKASNSQEQIPQHQTEVDYL